jgi:O-antigen ligase
MPLLPLFYIIIFIVSFMHADMSVMILANLGTFNIYYTDIVYVLVIICIPVVLRKNKVSGDKPYLIFLSWLLFSTVYGLTIYGYRAIGETRYIWMLFVFFIPIYFFVSDRINTFEKYEKVFNTTLLTACISVLILFAIEVINGGRFFFAAANEELLNLADFRGNRYLGTEETLILSAYVIAVLSKIIAKRHSSAKDVLIIIILTMIIIFTKNRTAPVSICIALVIVLLLERKIKYFIISTAVVILSVTLLIIVIPDISDNLFKAFSGVINIEEDSTGYWRYVVQTSALLQGMETPIIGQGFGGYFEFYVPELGKVVEYPPHNMYIFIFLKSGLIGVILCLVMLFSIIHTTIKMKKETEQNPAWEKYRLFFSVIFIAQIPYMMAYGFSLYFGLFVGFLHVFRILIKNVNKTSINPSQGQTNS